MISDSTQQKSELGDPKLGYRARTCSLPAPLGASHNKASTFFTDRALSQVRYISSHQGEVIKQNTGHD